MADDLPTVREINGQLCLDDPTALGVIQAVEHRNRAIYRHNCDVLVRENADRISHFLTRMAELGRTAEDSVIVLINVDDEFGGMLADALMPGYDWQAIRDRGEIPIARGLAERSGIQAFLEVICAKAAAKLKESKEVCIVVVQDGISEVFTASEAASLR